VEVTHARVEKVPVRKGFETRLLVGVFSAEVGGTTKVEIYDRSKEMRLSFGIGSRSFALPVGQYFAKIGERFVDFTIKDGEITRL
jgi:hypothetical protein